MKEIEILVEVKSSYNKAKKVLDHFEFVGTSEVIDVYYYDPLRENLKPNKSGNLNACFRVRSKNNKNYITYKTDNFDSNGKWIYSDEYETNFQDVSTLKKIIELLGLKKLLVIHNKRRVYKYGAYEITLENVLNLGRFLEVEYETDEDVDVLKIKKEIQEFIDGLDLSVSDELNMGKPEMMMKKNNIKIL